MTRQERERRDDDVNMDNTSELLFRLCANTDPQRDGMVAVRKDSPIDNRII